MKKIWALLIAFLLLLPSSVFGHKTTPNRKIRVLVIDTGIAPLPELEKFLPKNKDIYNYTDTHGHGTHVAGIIAYGDHSDPTPVCDSVEIVSCKYKENVEETNSCLKKAILEKFDFVNFSAVGELQNEDELNYIKKLSDLGTIIIVAAGNKGVSLQEKAYYPAGYIYMDVKNIIAVGSLDASGKRSKSSNYGAGVVYERGEGISSFAPNGSLIFANGTSQAAAMHTNKLLNKACGRQHE